jgi:hypothetical protein
MRVLFPNGPCGGLSSQSLAVCRHEAVASVDKASNRVVRAGIKCPERRCLGIGRLECGLDVIATSISENQSESASFSVQHISTTRSCSTLLKRKDENPESSGESYSEQT